MLTKLIIPFFLYVLFWVISLVFFANTPGLISSFPLYFEIVGFYLPIIFIVYLIYIFLKSK
ncbi:hypothetical protein CJP74_07925 [Psittacicella melopsittaci]|uniref:Uncharacterized protein n=1 Tax=Psittacicella melopsittaci TaxID=2028576 RepID=A0A3A1Y0Q6_9GAMM|nr:hypothetical protein CJP74_07925 [Psittacicella melopsittaci]